ncbi:MAG: imidazoleglycerol-phosphate dehydratase [Treponema sp.]|jgi:imidazoleglycerol-phosphate dehydratase|nr:imidazoleglycerol-phosphate dehydratase [Treponema sp.]
MPVRSATVSRATAETDITITLNIDGTGEARLSYPLGFVGHMLTAFARHGLFNLDLKAAGDLHVDPHHLVEDTGIVLGGCFREALGERRGLRRAGSCLYPMDETLARAACDLSGRPFLEYHAPLSGEPLMAEEQGRERAFYPAVFEDFWQGFTSACGLALHLDVLRGRSDHHKMEALFKAAGRALREACEIDPRAAHTIPSTKGVLA